MVDKKGLDKIPKSVNMKTVLFLSQRQALDYRHKANGCNGSRFVCSGL